jgi:UDP-galactopyranose mutase
MITKNTKTNTIDLICLSHLRWGFVFQRPQHLMSRFAKNRRVYFVEEPIFEDRDEAVMRTIECPQTGVKVVTPALPGSYRDRDVQSVLRGMLNAFVTEQKLQHYVAWFYTPMALEYAGDLTPEVTVYDCMDELSLFRGAPARLCENEKELLRQADLVFTGGVSLFEAKCKSCGTNIYPFPSGVDVPHFAQARTIRKTASDQAHLPRPRIGYAGVIDERIDLELIDYISESRPDWQVVMVGPVVKIDPASLPQRANLHWLGMKDYRDLPTYFAGWDAALLPFALNDATRFISPTKTPEYLAAGLPVISTPIRDVVRPYGDLGLARIAKTAEEFVFAVEQSMTHGLSMKWRERADSFLRTLSWDETWGSMSSLIDEVVVAKARRPAVMTAGGGFTIASAEGGMVRV